VIAVEDRVEVARDPADVYAFLSVVERYPEWLPGVSGAEQTSPGEVAVGTTFRIRLTGPSGPIDADGAVIAAEPGRALTVRGQAPQGRVEGALRLEPIEGGTTELWIRMQIELVGMYQFAEGLVGGELRRAMPGVLARVKGRIEADAPR
jgi:carbon monoxide dehydrogenase subunit G